MASSVPSDEALTKRENACLGEEHVDGKAGRGSENKIPIVAAFCLNEGSRTIHAKIPLVAGFS